MIRRCSSARSLRLAPVLLGVLLLTLLLAPAALATVDPGPITWLPAESTYGVAETPFVAVPMAPPGIGATSLAPGAAYGAGFWDDGSEVYVMGFLNAMPMSAGMPGMAETELGLTPLFSGVPLELVFEKTAGQRIDAVAMLGDPDSLVSIEPADPARSRRPRVHRARHGGRPGPVGERQRGRGVRPDRRLLEPRRPRLPEQPLRDRHALARHRPADHRRRRPRRPAARTATPAPRPPSTASSRRRSSPPWASPNSARCRGTST